MLHVDDDMDNLFRRAAESYPLKTDGADWSKVVTGMQQSDAGNENTSNNNKKRRFLWLVLLLPLGWICNEYTGKEPSVISQADIKAKTSEKNPVTSSAAKNTRPQVSEPTPLENIATTDSKITGNPKAIQPSQQPGSEVYFNSAKRNTLIGFAPQKNSLTNRNKLKSNASSIVPQNKLQNASDIATPGTNQQATNASVDAEMISEEKNNEEKTVLPVEQENKKNNTETPTSDKAKKESPVKKR